jgi:iron complex transport system ATP-binding protein
VGPNGAGKTTLLRAATGLLRPTGGRVELDGEPVGSIPRDRLAKTIAVVPGQGALPFSMRVEEVVALGRIPHEDRFTGPTDADREAVARAMTRAGIEHLRGRDARELSLGERQLVLIATALAQEGRLLILDEPTVHLDLRHQVEVLQLLGGLSRRDGITVVAVLHDLALAAAIFPRLILLHEGRIVADGPPAEVLAPGLVQGVYGVDPRYLPRLDTIPEAVPA